MPLGIAYGDVLPLTLQNTLESVGNALIDQFFEDVCTISSAGDALTGVMAESDMSRFLPRRYLSRYTALFAKRFLVCLTVVTWKLAQPQRIPLACVGEQLALRALIRQVEGNQPSPDVVAAFAAFWTAVQVDPELDALFDDARDGIEVTREHAHLAYSSWFTPTIHSLDGRPDVVHPYLEGNVGAAHS